MTLLTLTVSFTTILLLGGVCHGASPTPEFTYTPIVSRNKTLANVKIPCCLNDWWPYTFSNQQRSPPYDGWAMVYFNRLLETTGLTCANWTLWKADANRYVNMLVDCKENKTTQCPCQFGATLLWENPTRTGVDYLPDIGKDSVFVVTPVSNTTPKTPQNFVFNAFATNVWICIAALCVGFTALKMLDSRFSTVLPIEVQEQSVDDDVQTASSPAGRIQNMLSKTKYEVLKSRHLYRLRKSVQSTVSTLIGHNQHFKGEDRSTRMWIVNVMIVLSGIFLVLVYEASMTSLLVKEGRGSNFEDITSFQNCTVSDDEICFVKGDSMETFWNNSMVDQPCRRSLVGYPKTNGTIDKVVSLLLDGDCKYMLADGGTAAKVVNGRHCGQLTVTGTEFLTRSMAFVMSKNWKYGPQLSRAMLEIQISNQLPTFQEYVQQFHTCAETTLPTISLRRLRIFFVLAFAFCAVVITVMILDPQKPAIEATSSGTSSAASERGEEGMGSLRKQQQVQTSGSFSSGAMQVDSKANPSLSGGQLISGDSEISAA